MIGEAAVREQMWDVQDVADFLKVSRWWVYEQTRHKSGLPFRRLGPRQIRFDPEAVREWAKKQRE